MDTTNVPHADLVAGAGALIPPLTESQYKGSSGRVAIIGGSAEYSGAPALAAIAALRTGADLVHVFCHPEASLPIKSFAPDLVVKPYFTPECIKKIVASLPKVHAIVIGPGVGLEADALSSVEYIIKDALGQTDVPIVVDADGIQALLRNPSLVTDAIKQQKHTAWMSEIDASLADEGREDDRALWLGVQRVILTPNAMELSRMAKVAGLIGESPAAGSDLTDAQLLALSRKFGVTIVAKGAADRITDLHSNSVLKCGVEGTLRRAAGQGDTFSGMNGVFAAWRYIRIRNGPAATAAAVSPVCGGAALGCYAASTLMRATQRSTFEQLKRGMIASDLSSRIPSAFESLWSAL